MNGGPTWRVNIDIACCAHRVAHNASAARITRLHPHFAHLRALSPARTLYAAAGDFLFAASTLLAPAARRARGRATSARCLTPHRACCPLRALPLPRSAWRHYRSLLHTGALAAHASSRTFCLGAWFLCDNARGKTIMTASVKRGGASATASAKQRVNNGRKQRIVAYQRKRAQHQHRALFRTPLLALPVVHSACPLVTSLYRLPPQRSRYLFSWHNAAACKHGARINKLAATARMA